MFNLENVRESICVIFFLMVLEDADIENERKPCILEAIKPMCIRTSNIFGFHHFFKIEHVRQRRVGFDIVTSLSHS